VRELPAEDREVLEQIAAAHEADAIERALLAARERLGMDAAYVSQIDSTHQRIDGLVGDPTGLGFEAGSEIPAEDTYCARMLRGELPNVVPDTSAEPAVQGLSPTARLGSYVGVPVVLSDGTVHGSLCCASIQPKDHLGEAELAFMQVLAGMVAARIERARGVRPG
jgi:GAF domain-containing protein